jgi:undecaprenyl-diphosphatase
MSLALDSLIQADQELFLWLNGYHTPFWDAIMATVTYKFTWIPLYVFMVYSLYARFGAKAIGYFLCMIVVVLLADKIASGIFKPYFMRPRPCHDPVIGPLVHTLVGCGGQYGFVSSHSATGFGIALSFNLLSNSRIKLAPWLFLWAFVYSFSRIYVGVHYPLDLVAGGVVGLLTAFLVVAIYRRSVQNLHSSYFSS